MRDLEKADVLRVIKSAVFGVFISAGVLLLLLMLSAFLMSVSGIPLKTAEWISGLLLILAVFCGGISAALLSKKRGLLSGMLCGAVAAFCWILVFLFFGKAEFSFMILLRPLLCIAAGAAGGIIGINRKQRRIRY